MSEQTRERLRLPVLPLRDLVLFPGVTAPVGAGRPGTLKAIEAAVNTKDRLVFAVSQRENVEAVDPEILHTIGVVAKIGQVQRGLGGIQLLLHGEYRATVLQYTKKADHILAIVQEALDLPPIDPADAAFAALYKELRERAAELGEKTGISAEIVQQVLQTVSDAGALADVVGGYLDILPKERQAVLETLGVEERLRRVLIHVQRQIELLEVQEDIKNQVQQEIGHKQREIFLREQLKAIRKELGEEESEGEIDELRERLEELDLPGEARKEVERELSRLGRTSSDSMESDRKSTRLNSSH